ncbi:MAG: lipoyl(octanoyl) transferase LipB [Myxococcota bacterium]
MTSKIGLVPLGVVPYGQALALQYALREQLRESSDEFMGYVLCLEHPPTITLGKRGKPEHLVNRHWIKEKGVEVYRVNRGGEATYHGPGQLIVYPIIKLERLGMGVVDLIRGLAGSLGSTLAEFGIEAAYDPDHPGVWTQDEEPHRKVASVGMRVQGGVTTHGAAINLVNDMIPFSMIVPCGMPNAPMARLVDYLEEDLTLEDFRDRFVGHFEAFLERDFDVTELELPAEADWEAPMDVA